MIKKGFTLSEMLITLGIIGVIAAVTVPAVVGHLPCKSKINFLKAYNSLSTIISDISSDDMLYPATCTNKDLTCTDEPLDKSSLPKPASEYTKTGTTKAYEKLAVLVASKMNLSNDYDKTNKKFTTTDGTEWTFTENNAGDNISSISIKVLGDSDTTNTFSATIDKYGGVHVPAFEREVLNSASDTKKASFKVLMKKYK